MSMRPYTYAYFHQGSFTEATLPTVLSNNPDCLRNVPGTLNTCVMLRHSHLQYTLKVSVYMYMT